MSDESRWQTNAMLSFEHPRSKKSHTLKDWVLDNKCRFESSVGLQHLADDLIAKSDQIQDIAVEVIKLNKRETEHCLQEKIKDIEYQKNETAVKQEEVVKELDILGVYKKRLSETLSSISKNIIEVDERCLKLREHRKGIDLVNDEVKHELLREIVMVKGAIGLLTNVLEEAKERYRKLKAALYFLDRDILEKNENLQNNQYALNLRDRELTLKCAKRYNCNQSNTTLKEWEYQTVKNLNDVMNEIKNSNSLRDHIDLIIKDAVNDLIVQINQTNEAFSKRIDETKREKTNLESYHAEILIKANEMEKNIKNLEKSIADKEGFLALAQIRLNTHCKRSNLENVRDSVQMNLVKEIRYMNEIVTKLHQTIIEAQDSHRLLLKKQIQLEEDINIKINTLKIDEVDCAALRATIDIHAY